MTISISRSSSSLQNSQGPITENSFKNLIENISHLKVFESGKKDGKQWIKISDHRNNQLITLKGTFILERNKRVNWRKSKASFYEKTDSSTGEKILSASNLDFAGKRLEAVARGNDQIFQQGQTFRVIGSFNNDIVRGKDCINVIYGKNGNDKIFGGELDDYLSGGNQNDTLDGSTGDDTIHGGRGNDIIYGGNGSDKLFGGSLNDTIFGGNGNDTISGGSKKDLIKGQQGDDHLIGGRGDDTLRGATGNDTISGGKGNDIIFGGKGIDKIYGGEGDDTIYGGDGNDYLHGEAGIDELTGGKGIDTFSIKKESGHTVITDFEDNTDRIWVGKDTKDLKVIDAETMNTSPSNTAPNSNNNVHILQGDDLMAIVQNLNSNQLSLSEGFLT
jgi:Ca2+-binding RTX toxin-like protein